MTTEHEMKKKIRTAMLESGMEEIVAFEDSDVITIDTKFIVTMSDGSEFHVTVQKCR